MFVKVADSQVPERETSYNVMHVSDGVILTLQDKHVEAIALHVKMTDEETNQLAVDLLAALGGFIVNF